MSKIKRISAVTLTIQDMAQSVSFYKSLGFSLVNGGPEAEFSTFWFGNNALNLMLGTKGSNWTGWGRIIFYVSDVDEAYQAMTAAVISPEFEPRDAPWGERYFHVRDPDGHELSFAAPLES